MPAASQLKREIGLFSAIAIVVANMVGTGIFTTSGFILQEVGSPAALLLSWMIGGAFALCGALCYGELGARYPQAGGEYVYLREAFGKPVAFLSGWISLIVGFSAPIAAAAIAFATYLLKTVGAPGGPDHTVELFGAPVLTVSLPVMLAIAVVLLISALHGHSLRAGSRVQNLLTLFKIALVVGFVVAGLLSSQGATGHFSGSFSAGTLLDGKFAVALIFISFAYSGWNAAAYLGGEIKRPSRNIPLAMLTGTLIVTALYLLLNLVYVYALPADEMKGVMEVAAAAGARLFGPGIGRWLNGAIALGLLSVLSAMILAGPRVYYAMSRTASSSPFSAGSATRATPLPMPSGCRPPSPSS
jgi:APA family basic amino acid/polyamine antiporter